jgi:hypothetical protein
VPVLSSCGRFAAIHFYMGIPPIAHLGWAAGMILGHMRAERGGDDALPPVQEEREEHDRK